MLKQLKSYFFWYERWIKNQFSFLLFLLYNDIYFGLKMKKDFFENLSKFKWLIILHFFFSSKLDVTKDWFSWFKILWLCLAKICPSTCNFRWSASFDKINECRNVVFINHLVEVLKIRNLWAFNINKHPKSFLGHISRRWYVDHLYNLLLVSHISASPKT